jgi:hypothetical protein
MTIIAAAGFRRVVFVAVLLSVPFLAVTRPCAQWNCTGSAPFQNRSGAIDMTDPTQTGRLVLDGIASTCVPNTSSLFDSTLRHYDVTNFLSAGQMSACLTVTVDALTCTGPNAIYGAVYSPSFDPANPAMNVVGEAGASPSPTGSFSAMIPAGIGNNPVPWQVVFSEVNPNAGCPAFNWTFSYRLCRQPGFAYGPPDRKVDATVWRPATGTWYTLDDTGTQMRAAQFGASTDIITPGIYQFAEPYFGGTTQSVWRPAAAATWFYLGVGLVAQPFGTTGDIPVPTSFDADGKTDFTVFRPSTGTWWTRLSSSGAVLGQPFGAAGDIPFAGDIDGDFITDHGIVRPVGGSYQWWILRSRDQSVFAMTFGFVTDKPVAADYDGDRRTDIAVWRPSDGFWYYIRSSDGVFTGFPFGQSGDIPQPADRDGDGKADFSIFRQSATPEQQAYYFTWLSATGTMKSEAWGMTGDQPATSQNRIQ